MYVILGRQTLTEYYGFFAFKEKGEKSMKMVKKWGSLLLTLLVCVNAFAACGRYGAEA